MTMYRYRPNSVEAMYFDGSPVGARAVIDWLLAVAPDLTVRQRVEYKGWGDLVGHVELEIRDHEDQCASGDWIVIEQSPDHHRVRVMEAQFFHRCFELDLT